MNGAARFGSGGAAIAGSFGSSGGGYGYGSAAAGGFGSSAATGWGHGAHGGQAASAGVADAEPEPSDGESLNSEPMSDEDSGHSSDEEFVVSDHLIEYEDGHVSELSMSSSSESDKSDESDGGDESDESDGGVDGGVGGGDGGCGGDRNDDEGGGCPDQQQGSTRVSVCAPYLTTNV
jgi:hypothetical protein